MRSSPGGDGKSISPGGMRHAARRAKCARYVAAMEMHAELERQVQSIFAQCPELWGFSVRGENGELFVSDVGIAPRLSAEQYGAIFQHIATTLAEFLDERPEATDWLRGRTFARTLH
jgi:hypothetical protein